MDNIEFMNLTIVEENKPVEDLMEIIRLLQSGEVLRINQENSGTILVRLSPGRHKLTEISKDIMPETSYYRRHWLPYNVALNALIAFDVYVDSTYTLPLHKFMVDDKVEYVNAEGAELDIAYIKEVLTDGSEYFYHITGTRRVFRESELAKLIK